MKHVSGSVKNVVYPMFEKKGRVFAEIALHWREIIGPYYVDFVTPVTIYRYPIQSSLELNPLNDGLFNDPQKTSEISNDSNDVDNGRRYIKELVVLAKRDKATDLSFIQDMIIERINNFVGFKAIDTLKVRVG